MTDSTKKRIIRWFWGIFLFFPAAFLFMFLLVWLFAKIPSFEELESPDSKLATQLISEDGEILATYHIENRSYVSYDQLSPYLVQAAVATEDRRFYNHSGVDFRGMARVLVKTILLRDSSQGGGSTITQQLAKTLYPRSDTSSKIPGGSAVKMVWIKLKEWITAIKLERNYTKEEIVDMYLNAIFFGSNAYGIKAAAQTFFAKDPADLTIEESATLVGMVNKPTRYNPVINPDKALGRRNFVIGKMQKSGFISRSVSDSVQQIPITVNYQVQDQNAGHAPYFRDMLRKYMNASKPKRSDYKYAEEFSADSLLWADDQLYGWLKKNRKANGEEYNLDKDGLRIYTTINYKMQKYAEEAVTEHLGGTLQKSFDREQRYNRNAPFANDVDASTIDYVMRQARRWSDRYRMMKKGGRSENEILASFSEPVSMRIFSYESPGYKDTLMTPDDSIRYYKSILRCAFMVMEPGTGRIKAYVGGPNYRYFKYDNVHQGRRQVGSTIKPFLYTLAMQEGLSPCTEVVNLPQTIIAGDDSWTPRSTDKEETIGKTVTLRWGLTNSSNNISAYLMKQFGPAAMTHIMHEMGISSYVEEVPSICVGACDLSVYEMVSAYNTFPSGGVYSTPIFVTRIEDNQGNLLGEFSGRKHEAISEETAYTMVNMMRSVIDHGTGVRLRFRYNFKGPIAGKTGTTNDNSDGWFMGYTPNLTGGVWVGGEDRQVHFNSMSLGQGSNSALPIWAIFYRKVIDDGTLGISEEDEFMAPIGWSSDCDASLTPYWAGSVQDQSSAYFD